MPIKIPLLLKYIDETGKDTVRNMDISMSDPVNTERGLYRENNQKYSTNFTLKIPDHIWKYLSGRTVPNQEYGNNRPPQPKIYGKTAQMFPKTISRPQLDSLCSDWELLLHDYRWLRDVDDSGLTKVIFYNFDMASGDYQDEYSAKIRLGKIAKIRFTYCIGYRTTAGSYGDKKDARYDNNKVLFSSHSERKLYAMKFVKWTEKREQFFDGLSVDFDNVIDQIKRFESAMTEKGLNKLMEGRMKLLVGHVELEPGDTVLVTNQTNPELNGLQKVGDLV